MLFVYAQKLHFFANFIINIFFLIQGICYIENFSLSYATDPKLLNTTINKNSVFTNSYNKMIFLIYYSHNGGFALTYKTISYNSNTKNLVFTNDGFGLVKKQEKHLSPIDELKIKQIILNNHFFDTHGDYYRTSCADCHMDNLTITMNGTSNTVLWTPEFHMDVPEGILNIVDEILNLCNCKGDIMP